jgi:hypothetical protein
MVQLGLSARTCAYAALATVTGAAIHRQLPGLNAVLSQGVMRQPITVNAALTTNHSDLPIAAGCFYDFESPIVRFIAFV